MLSEAAVLGFEYGYSTADPNTLTIWEAQFGDFANVAQVYTDQFIASGETKWGRMSGLTMLLPHGYEGQGPEHSSARLERFLELCADGNMQVCNLTTPAQLFHAMRRQLHRRFRKPLIIMSPKSLLRHKAAVSPVADFTSGTFQPLIGDATASPEKTKRVLFVSGKFYYSLLEARIAQGADDTAIVRVEQMYPFPDTEVRAELERFANASDVCWVQEEPENMGAWHYLRVIFGDSLFQSYPFAGISRSASASPATGSHEAHKLEQQEILAQALTGQ